MAFRASPTRLLPVSAPNMATTAAPCTPAPWRSVFLSHVSSMPQPTLVLSTLHPVEPGVTRHGFSLVPRARTCIYRGLWGTWPSNGDRNPAPRNAQVFESDLPVITTDIRMEKAAEIVGTAATPSPFSGTESGGGGPVEAVWWAEPQGTQWRVRGTAWVLGPDIDGDGRGARAVREALRERMRRAGDGGKSLEGNEAPGSAAEAAWSWSREVTGHFGNLSPGMRGTFRNPPPGRPVTLPVDPDSGLGIGQTVDDVDDQVARRNFRVVVIVPDEVDQVDLSDMKNPKRWLYVYRGASYKTTQPGGEVIGEWEKVELWP
ncbi:pyridoxamine 5'-phosphate oxidase-domain-containing protein [Echria macrotheca]|uniref:Pyridoxamine 5'-phosphate oxidase-domain-containing protein n=1 Tax=Echria macrotheca TaxID=438768 RepID=A0AAJ0F9X0_9PEZI|nr:pyridoxamine 5'-phosphate oxidase-domain-containing protein [Echria macrotheca]